MIVLRAAGTRLALFPKSSTRACGLTDGAPSTTPLTRYYSAEGVPPGSWLGSGLDAIGGEDAGRLRSGDPVTEEQLARLLGAGIDPVTGGKLGAGYLRLEPPSQRIVARVARLDAALDETPRAQQVQQIRDEEHARTSRTPVAGFGLTFSPPKSLSVLWGVTDARTQTLFAQGEHRLEGIDVVAVQLFGVHAGQVRNPNRKPPRRAETNRAGPIHEPEVPSKCREAISNSLN